VRLAVVGAVALATPLLSLGGATATTRSGLRGLVLRSAPVCRTDSCEEPAAGVLLRFTRAGRVVTTVKSTSSGRYSVRLRAGTYRVKAPRAVGAGLAPRVVRVPKGRIARVDFHLDTGTQ
jgi:carboxypeptidase family protein